MSIFSLHRDVVGPLEPGRREASWKGVSGPGPSRGPTEGGSGFQSYKECQVPLIVGEPAKQAVERLQPKVMTTQRKIHLKVALFLFLMIVVLLLLDLGLAKALPTGSQGRLWKSRVNLGQTATHVSFSAPWSLPLPSPVHPELCSSVRRMFLTVLFGYRIFSSRAYKMGRRGLQFRKAGQCVCLFIGLQSLLWVIE